MYFFISIGMYAMEKYSVRAGPKDIDQMCEHKKIRPDRPDLKICKLVTGTLCIANSYNYARNLQNM
jgi:hypothetical protein